MIINEDLRQNKANVFLSYSHTDSSLVEKLAQWLCEAGFSCWIDSEKIRAGEEYNSAIDIAIDNSIVFIAFLSRTYVNKPYCIHEYDRAIDKNKSILAVCIDDVSEYTNRQSAYMFSFCAGHNILGLGSGVDESDSFAMDAFAKGIAESVPMTQLKQYLSSGDINDYPPISTPDYIMASLRIYHEKQYMQSGNYALNEIRSELFPAMKNPELNVLYQDAEGDNVPLIEFFSQSDGVTEHSRHILITGEGGLGKTVSLLKTCEYLLSKRVNAVYVPLSKINADMTLDKYLERYVCKGNQQIWQHIQYLMNTPYTSVPNFVLLLDGINEIPLRYIDSFVKTDLMKYIETFPGVRLIMTSRWFDNTLMNRLRDHVVSLEMQTLNRESIESYLQNLGLPPVTDEKVLSVIKTPLMLTLYADIEKHKEKYQTVVDIVLEEEPDTAGKILSNFFQTQLFRAAEEKPLDRGEYLILIEYLLPKLAFRMLTDQSQYIGQKGVNSCINEIRKGEERFIWYKDDVWDLKTAGRSGLDVSKLLGIVLTDLHFLNKTEDGYEFLHPIFRDYFAAYFLASELRAYMEDKDRFSEETSLLCTSLFSNEILNFVSDIVREESARPVLQDNGWIFPGKKNINPSENSLAEAALSLWRNKEGESAQIAVANILNIMKIGRHGLLAWCDFSDLDLRKCWLNECRFTLWYQDQYYSSSFDGAYMNRENFLTDGHESPISAIEYDGQAMVFSGNNSGTVKIFDLREQVWVDSFQFQSDAVIDLAWDSKTEQLAVLYENIVFCYSIREKCVVSSFGNNIRSKSFRYVRFSAESELNISFDLEPLTWYDLCGNRLTTSLDYDVPARCAKWNPRRKEFLRSNLLQLLSVFRYNEKNNVWVTPPELTKRMDEPVLSPTGFSQISVLPSYLQLRDVGASKSGSVSCIRYKEDGTRVLVAIQRLLIEYDTESFNVLNIKTFPFTVLSACYLGDGVAVGSGYNLVFLDADFSEELTLPGSQSRSIGLVSEDHEGNGYYIFSSNGEIKKLSSDLIVQNMRSLSHKTAFIWARDRLTDAIQMAFLPWAEYPFGARYSYETDRLEPLGWRYELLESPSYFDDEQSYYRISSSLMVLDRVPPYQKKIYSNYSGIWIFACSFDRIRGDMASPRNKHFLIQNGGVIHDVIG